MERPIMQMQAETISEIGDVVLGCYDCGTCMFFSWATAASALCTQARNAVATPHGNFHSADICN
jgi:predicted  nucleic acid-binding Zn-ribbon protein